MDAMQVQWYPGHMTKTRRQIEADLKQVDGVCELADARIPLASRNPDIDALCAGKPRILLLNRMDLADSAQTAAWLAYFRAQGITAAAIDCKNRRGLGDFRQAVSLALREKLARDAARGMNRPARLMVVGIPNVGKSTFINQIAGRKGAKAENRPGVTRGKQWVTVDRGLLLLDTPGILWPKFEDPNVGLLLAITGAIKEDVLDTEALAARLMAMLAARYPDALAARYGQTLADVGTDGFDLLAAAGKQRGFRISGGEIDTARMARTVLDEFRAGKLGRITLEEAGKRL